MSDKCIGCKYFKVDEDPWPDWKRANPGKWGECTQIEHRDENAPPLNGKAYTMDGSNYHSQLNVSSDFGCVLFEKDTN